MSLNLDSDNIITLSQLEEKLAEFIKEDEEYKATHDKPYRDTDSYTQETPNQYNILDLEFGKDLFKYTNNIQWFYGKFLVNDIYWVTRGNRWWVKNKDTKYYYKSLDDLFSKYIN